MKLYVCTCMHMRRKTSEASIPVGREKNMKDANWGLEHLVNKCELLLFFIYIMYIWKALVHTHTHLFFFPHYLPLKVTRILIFISADIFFLYSWPVPTSEDFITKF